MIFFFCQIFSFIYFLLLLGLSPPVKGVNKGTMSNAHVMSHERLHALSQNVNKRLSEFQILVRLIQPSIDGLLFISRVALFAKTQGFSV